jgi:SDR family mycofactocin-dependent oxidoreductase
MGRIEGKVAFITGAARGQGRSHALHLAKEGADVIAIDLTAPIDTVPYPMATPEDLEETVRLVEGLNRRAIAASIDIRDLAGMRGFLDSAVHQLGRLDIVCANAGVLSLGPLIDLTEEQWQETIDVNLTGTWKTIKAAVARMITAGNGGSVIITSSVASGLAYLSSGHYTAAKLGLVGLARVLAREVAEHDIRVNTIHPTNVISGMTDNETVIGRYRPDLDEPTFDDLLEGAKTKHPLRIGALEPDEISKTVLYLASDDSRYVTGSKHLVDAGTGLV